MEDVVWWARFHAYLGTLGALLIVWSLWFAGWAAIAAAKAAKAAETAIRLSERPNVWVEKIAVNNPKGGERTAAKLEVKNLGKAPARILAVVGGYAISTVEKVSEVPPYREGTSKSGIIGPLSTVDFDITIRQPLTPEEATEILWGRKFLFLYGKITIADEFGWTCDIGYGAQHGNYGDGEIITQLMQNEAYTFVRWIPPRHANKSVPLIAASTQRH